MLNFFPEGGRGSQKGRIGSPRDFKNKGLLGTLVIPRDSIGIPRREEWGHPWKPFFEIFPEPGQGSVFCPRSELLISCHSIPKSWESIGISRDAKKGPLGIPKRETSSISVSSQLLSLGYTGHKALYTDTYI